MSKMKRLISIVAAFSLILCLCGCEEKEKYPSPTEEFYVNDFADVMTEGEEGQFLAKTVALNNATTAQVVIATVEHLSGDEPYAYATELGRQWGIGNSENDNGILILLARDDREIFIAVGYGLEGALPDSKTGRIIDVYGLDYLKNDQFGKGLLAIGEAVINEVYLEYGIQPEAGYVSIDSIPVVPNTSSGKVVSSWAIMLVVLIIIWLLSRRGGGGLMFFGMPHIHTGRSRGGFGSSSGFGGFRGGGGSFGGGGAGRGF